MPMRRTTLLILLAFLVLPLLGQAEDMPLPPPLPDADYRAVRELQAKDQGVPMLPAAGAPRQEALLGIAELGANASSGQSSRFEARDYDALFSLLQRYRDDLLKLGMDRDALEAQLITLRQKTKDLEERLSLLQPKDGLKVHGSVSAAFDDMHLIGDLALPASVMPGSTIAGLTVAPKPAGVGVRWQEMAQRANLDFTFNRGPATALVRFDIVAIAGANGKFDGRRIYMEMRLPVAIQIGDIDTALTPLTLWRNDDLAPFEPELFVQRRNRLVKDMMLVPNRWPVSGARLSTQLELFDALTLELVSLSSVINGAGSTQYITFDKKNFITRYNTYMQGWSVTLPLADDKVRFSTNGLLFWDVNSTAPAATVNGFSSMVQSGRVDVKWGIVRAEAEMAMSSYAYPVATSWTASVAPLTGTAMTGSLGVQGKYGHIKGFGRAVANSFHSAGAQGRTQDMNYAPLGPFLTDNSFVNADGTQGWPNAGAVVVPNAPETRLNAVLLPPGMMVGTAAGSLFQHLLPYSFTEMLSPYGQATPNRVGGGLDGEGNFLNGAVKPAGTYETYSQIDSPGGTLSPFALQRMRGGVTFDLEPAFGWPLSFGGGMTMDQSSNGQKTPTGRDYTLTVNTTDVGGRWKILKDLAFLSGWRHTEAKGLSDAFAFPVDGRVWDMIGNGISWDLQQGVMFEALFSQILRIDTNVPRTGLEVDQIYMRASFEF